MTQQNDVELGMILKLIDEGKITEIDAERLLNAATRFKSGMPTGANLPRK